MSQSTSSTHIEFIHVTLEDGRVIDCPSGTLVGELLPEAADAQSGLTYLGALVNNELVTFGYALDIDSHVRFVTMASTTGMQIYTRSLTFLLAKAVKDVFPKATFSVEHAIGAGLFCEFENDGSTGISQKQADKLTDYMQQLVEADTPIQRVRLSYTHAMQKFEQNGQDDKTALLRFSSTPKIVTYSCGDFTDLAHGPMTRSMGPLRYFKIIPHGTGFVLQMPTATSAPVIPEFRPMPALSAVFKEYNCWGKILSVNTVGRLNEIISAGEIHDFIKVAEALHENKIAEIAQKIAQKKNIKWILIAGPSSSGKTTFAKRLAIQLRVNGLFPVTLGMDDYFVNRDRTPRTEDGAYDFEHIRAVDIECLNNHLSTLDAGGHIDCPSFDFVTGTRHFKGNKLTLAPGQVGIIEGIHSLNPELTPSLPEEKKYRIYISALTQLNLDNSNRIPTTDNRLVRRLVRDHHFRGHSALKTLDMWPNVGRGERTWIFPFQQEADSIFNSALDYELAVLSFYAKPLLEEIKPHHTAYAEARRILEFLAHFLPLDSTLPPPTSIIREFIGKSSFTY